MGDVVRKGDTLLSVSSEKEDSLTPGADRASAAISLSAEPPQVDDLISFYMDKNGRIPFTEYCSSK